MSTENTEHRHHSSHGEHHHSHSHSGEEHSHSHSSHSSGDGNSHHHSHHSQNESMKGLSLAKKAIKLCMGINIVYLVAEAIIGMRCGSLSLVADAGYNLGDVLVLALAFYSLKLKTTPSYQYDAGVYKKYSALSLIVNTVLLLVASGAIAFLAWGRTNDDWANNLSGLTIAITAGVGIIVNGLTTLLLRKNQSRTAGVKNAFVNMAADTFISIVVLVAGVVLILNPSYGKADAIAALIAALVTILFTTRLVYGYVKKGFHMVPDGLEVEPLISTIKLNENVKNYKHVNIWRNNADEVELSAHLSLLDMGKMDEVKRQLKHELRKQGVDIVTLSFKQHKEQAER